MSAAYLPPTADLPGRVDTAQVLTRFHYCERALTLACGAWIPAVPRLETKALLARTAWQNSLAGDALRERVFELRYPSRLLEAAGGDASVTAEYEAVVDLEDASSFLAAVANALSRLLGEYTEFLVRADALADGPTIRIVEAAIRDKEEQVDRLGAPEEPSTLPQRRPYRIPDTPARDERYFRSSFYWPDVVDPAYPYGEGLALQLRSAVSHLNEVWAVDTAGAILYALAPELGWELIRDAARWTYDESRHMLMGQRRLDAWGLDRGLVPLGGYIYEACAGEDAIYRLGMLGYFETKNIGRKRERAESFRELGDRTSEVDMEFDWADETLHAEYGRRWLQELLRIRGRDPESWREVLERCETLVRARVARATEAEKERIARAAKALRHEAERVASREGRRSV